MAGLEGSLHFSVFNVSILRESRRRTAAQAGDGCLYDGLHRGRDDGGGHASGPFGDHEESSLCVRLLPSNRVERNPVIEFLMFHDRTLRGIDLQGSKVMAVL